MAKVWGLIRSMRPIQWLKNFALFAPLVFSGLLFSSPAADEIPYFFIVLYAVILFSLVTSAVYIINDISDIKADRSHPTKKYRPIAAGLISIRSANFFAFGLIIAAFLLSWQLSITFQILMLTYLILEIAYSKFFKKIPIFDVLVIALGFVLRVYAGAAVVNLHMNVWFLLMVISISLFLAVGKRQSELTLIGNQAVGETRQTLKRYSPRLLDQYIGMFANSTWLTYALFAFQYQYIQPDDSKIFALLLLPKTFQSEKLLMFTVPFVILGVMRYLQLIYEKNEGESPTWVLLKDPLLLGTVGAYGLLVLIIIYGVAIL